MHFGVISVHEFLPNLVTLPCYDKRNLMLTQTSMRGLSGQAAVKKLALNMYAHVLAVAWHDGASTS